MRRLRFSGALGVALLLGTSACVDAEVEMDTASKPEIDREAILAEIDALRDGFEEFVATLDMEMAAPMIAEGAMMVPPAGGGWSDMHAAAAEAGMPVPYAPGLTAEITPIETVVMSEEWVYDFGTSVFTWTPEGADEPVILEDTYLILLRNQGDGWKVWREVASANLPPDVM